MLINSPLSRDTVYYWKAARMAKHPKTPLDRECGIGDLFAVARIERNPHIKAAAARHLAVVNSKPPSTTGLVINIGYPSCPGS